jgi:hypothetical protein
MCGRQPIVASKPNDLAGKRRGFGGCSTARNRNENGIKPMGQEKHKLKTPLLTTFRSGDIQDTTHDIACAVRQHWRSQWHLNF